MGYFRVIFQPPMPSGPWFYWLLGEAFKECRGKQKALVSYIFNSYLILDFLSFSLFYRLCAHFQSIDYFSVSRLILAYLGIFIPPNGLNIALKWTIFSSSFRISDNVRRVHLHQVRLHKKASLTRTRTTDNKNVFISCILRLFRSARHHQPFCLCQKDIIFKHRVHIWLYVLGISPPCEPYSTPCRNFLAFLAL